jgi:hypothetical protein
MKKLLLLLIVFVNIEFTYSQEPVNLYFDYNKKELKPKTEKINFKAGKTYQVIIHNVNSAIIGSELKSESYYLSSPAPDIISPFFQGISFASDVMKTKMMIAAGSSNPFDSIYNQAISYYCNLRALKIKSDYLYNAISDSLYNTGNIQKENNHEIAESVKNEVFEIFNAANFPELTAKVNHAIFCIEIANEVFKSKIEEVNIETIVNYNLVEKSAEILYISNIIKSENYPGYVSFIENSLNPDPIITSEPFKAEKDMAELKVTLIDTYKSDTLYNSSIPFYTSGNWSFSFSTGFFFNNLHEDSYYLEARDASKNNILKNDNPGYDVSFGALGHLSYKLTNCTKLGISMGAALSPLDGKTRYLIGGSIVFGREKQVGINSGLALVKMETLSDQVNHDAGGDYVAADVTDVPTYSKIRSGFYAGITYNFNLQKK